ncbi:MAG: trypsin-like peptidase domain-containing protein [Ferruginibacter sp.]
MKLKQILFTVLVSALTCTALVFSYNFYLQKHNSFGGQQPGVVPSNYKYAGFMDGTLPPGAVDFTAAAQSSTPAVVHIKTRTSAKQTSNNLPRTQKNPFSDFFDDDMFNQLFGGRANAIPEQRASGSGVLISDNGYIVTNNHVVQNADEIMVTLSNKKSYKAKVIGTDPAYDLAVIKVEASGLPYLLYGNSDDVKIGQWVLAIGYPLNLETTVTAGIVSAKARSLGLNRDKNGKADNAVESFIQTDAAVNMGNSGGALVNPDGRLIGINSAIASPTGYYSGYSYAIPVNIAKKVVDDIIKFGTVQRAYLGIQYGNTSDMSDEYKKANNIPLNAWGIYVSGVPDNGAAYASGIRKGDLIKSINGVEIQSGAELQEQISRYKPGDKIPVVYIRNDKEYSVLVNLKNSSGNFEVVKNETYADLLGADFTSLDARKAKELGVDGGVLVRKINKGAIFDQTRMKDGFIILKIDNKKVRSTEDLYAAIAENKNFNISGFYPGYDVVYDYPITLDN